MNNYENIKRVKINEYEILNDDNPYAIADSIHNCIAAIIIRQNSVVVAHLNDHMPNYETSLDKILNSTDDSIESATIYCGNDSKKEFVDNLSYKISKIVDCQVKKAPYNPYFNESSIGYDFKEKVLLVYDMLNFEIKRINDSEIEDLSPYKSL